MKYSYVLAALVGLVAAQVDPTIIPECARDCLTQAVSSASSCTPGDYACTCVPETQDKIKTAATPCVLSACGAQVAISEVLPASAKLCAAAAAAGGSASSAAASSAAASVSIPTSASGSASLPFTTSVTAVVSSSAAATTRAAGNGTAATTAATTPTTSAVPAGAGALTPVGGLVMLALGALAI
ncbi:hypothetical protein CCHL11_02311 [Colletotrichum chlorophyti]|uniref:CFEM domain-containing protein n=1 Tax=Colletotrichum chlorophyti TaxID=708187 RepID=A0A1Q8S5Z1_9PEZI|nr:hypothetical protein CCHL11_02311 [Colletotrichum chlorophyti]